MGAPKNNQNARKHGIYSRLYTPNELIEIESNLATTMLDDILYSRVLIKRLSLFLADNENLSAFEIVKTYHILSIMLSNLAGMLAKYKLLNTNTQDDIMVALGNALSQINIR